MIKTDPAIFFTAAKLEEAHFKQLADEAAEAAVSDAERQKADRQRIEQPKNIIKMGVKMLETQNVVIDRDAWLKVRLTCTPVWLITCALLLAQQCVLLTCGLALLYSSPCPVKLHLSIHQYGLHMSLSLLFSRHIVPAIGRALMLQNKAAGGIRRKAHSM